MTRTIPHATASESLRFALWHTIPALLRGTFTANPRLTRLAARLDTDRRAAAVVDRMRTRYGGRSVWITGPGGRVLLVLSRGDMRRVLDAPDRIFSTATRARRRGLGLVAPHALLVSDRIADREDRRRFHDAVLAGVDRDQVRGVVAAEIGALLAATSTYTWSAADAATGRIARRLVLGDDARDDTIVTRLNRALCRDANWFGYRPGRARLDAALRRALRTRVDRYVAGAREGSLAARIRDAPRTGRTDPGGQVPYWLMAFDLLPALVTNALALLARFPEDAARAEEEAAGGGPKPFVTACLMEAARLWAPVPNLTRVTTARVPWHADRLPAGTRVLIPLSLHQRGPALPYAHDFAPRVWLDGEARRGGWVAPLSAGPAGCPGADLGVLVGTEMLAALLATARFELTAPRGTGAVPATSDVRAVRMTIRSLAGRTGVSERAVPRQRGRRRSSAAAGTNRR
ncbi:MAG TPA: cytochrome P450 [Streptosporangiaceae bacterium]